MKKKLVIITTLILEILSVGCSKNTDQVMEYTSSISTDNTTELFSEVKGTDNVCEEEIKVNNLDEKNNEESEDSLSIIMVGDVLLHTPINEGALQEDGSYDFHHLFSQVSNEISDADMALVNQEVILGGTSLGLSGYPAFNGAYEVADALYDTGFDVILHATNHALDKGEKGILNCLSYWRNNYPKIKVLGIHESRESQNTICYIEEKGIKIAILNYTYGTNGITPPLGKEYLVDYLEEERVRKDIMIAKINSDFVIVCPHWGIEYNHEISKEQEKWTNIFWDEGVDLVIGTHPHVIEPIRMIEKNDKKMLVYYSLGNFINCTSGSGKGTADRMIGAMAKIKLSRKDDDVYIQDYGVEPLVTQMAYGRNEITTYFLKDYSKELANKNEVIKKDNQFSYEYCIDLSYEIFKGVWSSENIDH